MSLTTTIISNLLSNEDYARKIIPFIKNDYFMDDNESIVIDEVVEFFNKYSKLPTKEIICIQVENRKNLNDDKVFSLIDYISGLPDIRTNEEWLVKETEKYFKQRAVYISILDSIEIIEGKNSKYNQDAIPSILSNALGISFDKNVGHDYMEDSKERFDFYRKKEERLPFNLEIMDKITGGGLPKKSLSAFVAGPGVGKSLCLCHFASSTLLQGKNVLYITLEMSEERIAERIDANLLNLGMHELKTVEYEIFNKRVKQLKEKSSGKLIIKEYPTTSAHVGHFRLLLDELKVKLDYKPDLIIIDYINICASQRLNSAASANSYGYIKAIVEEMRGLAVEYDLPIMTATQANRQGIDNSEMEMTNVSESIGTVQTLDLLLAIISNDELENLGQVMIKQLKNRYNDLNYYKKFVLGIDRNKMRLFDVESNGQIAQPVLPNQLTKAINVEDFKF